MQSLKKSYSFAEAAKKANSVTEDEEDFRSDYSRYLLSSLMVELQCVPFLSAKHALEYLQSMF